MKRSAVFYQDNIFFLLGINFTELNPYTLKRVWDTESGKFIMNLKCMTISFLSEDPHLTFCLNVQLASYVTLQEENGVDISRS